MLPFEPPDETPQPSNFNALYSAEEPEWQCKASTAMGKDFFSQPVHCQKSQMQSGSIWLGGLFSSKTEYNVQRIQSTDSPLPDFIGSASDETLAYARFSTSKPDNQNKTKRKKGKKDLPQVGYVEIKEGDQPIDFSDTGGLNAEFDGRVLFDNRNQKSVDLAVSDVKNILSGDNDCAAFFGLGKVATVYSTENGNTAIENFYKANASIVADDLGNQLRANIGFLDVGSLDRKSIGIEMSGDITIVQSGTTNYRRWERAKVNINGAFIKTGSFGSYTGRTGRALAILHEIAHMIKTGTEMDKKGRIQSTYLIPDDKDKTNNSGDNQSGANTTLIEGKCKKELDALKALEK